MTSLDPGLGFSTLGVIATLGLASCASSPLDRPEVVKVKNEPALPLVVGLSLNVPEDPSITYGTREEWMADIRKALDDLDVCQAVWAEDDEREADATVHVKLARPPDAEKLETEGRVDGQAAVLTTIAWSTVPPLPLWLRDVTVTPGVEAQVVMSRTGRILGEDDLIEESPEAGLLRYKVRPAIATSLLDRHPFFSWSTLGSIVIPPFAFSGTDPEHLVKCISGRVREETALGIAAELKGKIVKDVQHELVKNVGLAWTGTDLVLKCTGHPDLFTLTLRLEDARSSSPPLREPATLPLRTSEHSINEPLNPEIFGGSPEGKILRLEAVGRPAGQAPLRYSVRVPPKETAPAVEGGD